MAPRTRRLTSLAAMQTRRTSQRSERSESPLTELESEDQQQPQSPPRKRRRETKVVEPVVYAIPPVESRTTTYRGRLGYACLNTILRSSKPDPIFCSRTCRIDTIHKRGLDFAKDLGIRNVKDLAKLIQWNEENRIRFMRISSDLFPFASHDKYGYDLDYAAAELKTAGNLANLYGHRMTLHPGQFTQIGSPKQNVVDASVRELRYHCSLLNYMGIGRDGVIIIHTGGVYGNKDVTLARFKENYRTLLSDDIKARLVIENDEMCYNVDDLLPISEELDLPIVLDYHHDWIYPSSEPLKSLIPRINEVWHRKGIKPKQHLSSPRPGASTVVEKRAHARRCDALPTELEAEGAGWWWRAPGEREWVDLMIEAKDKEQAVFQLYRAYDLAPVIWENLRPEQADPASSEDRSAVRGSKRPRRSADKDEERLLETPMAVDTTALSVVEPTVPKRDRRTRRRASRKDKGKTMG